MSAGPAPSSSPSFKEVWQVRAHLCGSRFPGNPTGLIIQIMTLLCANPLEALQLGTLPAGVSSCPSAS